MKEIHEDGFGFVPWLCGGLMRDKLLSPIPTHLVTQEVEDEGGSGTTSAKTNLTDGAFG